MTECSTGMPWTEIDYPGLIEDSKRWIVRQLIERWCEDGQPGAHWFRILIDSNHRDVDLPGWLYEEHPSVLILDIRFEPGHESYSDFYSMGDAGFGIEFNSGGRPATLHLPYESILRFEDRHANIGMTLVAGAEGDMPDVGSLAEKETPPKTPEGTIAFPGLRRKQ